MADYSREIVGDKGKYSGSKADLLRKALRANREPETVKNVRDASALGRMTPSQALKKLGFKENE